MVWLVGGLVGCQGECGGEFVGVVAAVAVNATRDVMAVLCWLVWFGWLGQGEGEGERGGEFVGVVAAVAVGARDVMAVLCWLVWFGWLGQGEGEGERGGEFVGRLLQLMSGNQGELFFFLILYRFVIKRWVSGVKALPFLLFFAVENDLRINVQIFSFGVFFREKGVRSSCSYFLLFCS